MKIISLSNLMKCTNGAWHKLIPLGTIYGADLVIDDSLIQHLCPDATYADTTLTLDKIKVEPKPFLSTEQINERMAICNECEFNRDDMCLKCQHCGGRKISYKIKAVFEFCPEHKWEAAIITEN